MILTDEEVNARLNSPLNLINRMNRLTKSNSMNIFIPSSSERTDESSAVPATESLNDASIHDILNSINNNGSVDDIIPDSEEKIKLGIVKSKAIDIMHDSLVMLGENLASVSKTEKLATIAREMKSIITDKNEDLKKGPSQVIVYKPIINDISKYETLVVNE